MPKGNYYEAMPFVVDEEVQKTMLESMTAAELALELARHGVFIDSASHEKLKQEFNALIHQVPK